MSETRSSSELKQFETALAGIEFRDRQRAALNYAEIAARVPAGVSQSLLPLMSETPDPDSALNNFERLTECAPPDLLRLLDRQRQLVHYAIVVFGYSQWLSETLIQNSDLFHALARDRNLGLSHSREDYAEAYARFSSRSLETDTALLLARFKRREYVRIMLRDVLGIGTLADTTAEISALTDVLIEQALRDADAVLRNRFGPPQHIDAQGRLVETPFTVLSMGKLGGRELNYSSDVDLMFIHGDGPEPPTAPISNHEYFTRLGQRMTETLSRMTVDGAPFRIDLRLRPQGGEGDPVVGLSHALDYYADRAADWELQALIKVRHSAGDLALAREFVRHVQPFVYTEQVNFSAIETALASREKMLLRTKRPMPGGGVDVKTDRGGIRDIEFLVQCLQRVYGGTEKWLRSGGTMFSLAKLHDKGHITSKEFHQLTTSYVFLRTVEHRLQLRRGQQTHRLPTSPEDLLILERSVWASSTKNFEMGLEIAIRNRMAEVFEIYERIVHHEQWRQEGEGTDEFRLLSPESQLGRDSEQRQILERIREEAPDLYTLARNPNLEAHTRRNLNRFFAAAFTSPERYAGLIHNKDSVLQAERLFALSDYLTDVLVRHPEEIASVSAPESARVAAVGNLFDDSQSSDAESNSVVTYVAGAELGYDEKLAFLRRYYRGRAFQIAARDVLEPRSVYESLACFAQLADEVIRAAALIVQAPPELAVMALGRLGSDEPDLMSDADLIFVREESLDPAVATRKAEQIVEVLSAYTREGTVLAVDTRLRPNGADGDLVVTPALLRTYFERHAQAWEALTYTKLRPTTGSGAAVRQTLEATGRLFHRFKGDPAFATHLLEVRAKLERLESDGRNLKTAPGGVYDIDYLVGYLLVKHGMSGPRGNLREAILSLRQRGLLAPKDAEILDHAAELLRTVEHAIRLVLGKARKTVPSAGPARKAVEELTMRVFGNGCGRKDLDAILQRTHLSVREIYHRELSPG